MHLPILFENDDLIAINKPHGLLVHRSRLAADAREFAVQTLRNQIGQRVYPAHRLDRKTSGVLLFSKNKETNSIIQQLFRERKINKSYTAIVRGWIDEQGIIEYPLTNENSTKEAVTHYKLIEKFEIDLPSHNFQTSRYSLIKLKPDTGRFHQLRKHMAHIFHPIIGDRPHGCNKQNKLWKERYNMTSMLLHAETISLEYPGQENITIQAPKSLEFNNALSILKIK